MKGNYIWVWVSIPPGITYLPAASTTLASWGYNKFSPTLVIFPSSINTSAVNISSAFTTFPPFKKRAYPNLKLFLLANLVDL